MENAPTPPPEFWEAVAEHVAAKVRAASPGGRRGRAQVIAYLRDLETVALCENDSQATTQVIASGLRALGDQVEPTDGRFSPA